MKELSPPEIWKRHAVLIAIPNEDSRMFGCQYEDRLIFILMRSKHPVHIRKFVVVNRDSDVMPPFILTHGLRLNMVAYIIFSTTLRHPLRPTRN